MLCAALPSQTQYTLRDLLQIEEQTAVLPKRQKLIGLKAKGGKPANDDLPVSDLTLKEGQKIMMMGQPEAHVEAMDKQSEVRRPGRSCPCVALALAAKVSCGRRV